MADEQVNTVFSVSDQASDVLARIAKQTDKLASSTAKAQRATKGVGVAAPASTGSSEHASIKAEARARKERIRTLKFHEARGNVAQEAVKGGLETVHKVSTDFAGGLAGAGNTIESLGLSMSQFGGKMGSVGDKLVSLGGKIGVAGAVFAAFYEIGEKLEHHFGLADTMLETYTKLMSDAQIKQNTLNYSKSLGYLSTEQYAAGIQVQAASWEQAKFNKNLEKAKTLVGNIAVPDDPAAVVEFEDKLLKAAAAVGFAPEQLKEAVDKMKEAAKNNVPTIVANRLAMIKHEEALKKATEGLMALPLNPLREEQEKQIKKLGEATQRAIGTGAVKPKEAGAFLEDIQAKLAARGDNVVEAFNANARQQLLAADITTRWVKNFEVVSPKANFSKLADMNERMGFLGGRIIADLETRLGKPLGEEERTGILEKTKESVLAKQQKVYDFRGSRFDIKQAFAEGFDPDRIAIAFSNDLAALSERSLQTRNGLVGLVK